MTLHQGRSQPSHPHIWAQKASTTSVRRHCKLFTASECAWEAQDWQGMWIVTAGFLLLFSTLLPFTLLNCIHHSFNHFSPSTPDDLPLLYALRLFQLLQFIDSNIAIYYKWHCKTEVKLKTSVPNKTIQILIMRVAVITMLTMALTIMITVMSILTMMEMLVWRWQQSWKRWGVSLSHSRNGSQRRL